MNYKNNYKKRGFTMIEMLVSSAIFAIVVTMVMGTITTIVDASRKARTMTEVMNNLNFSFESMTRTLKTARTITGVSDNGSIGTIEAVDQQKRDITYTFTKGGGISKTVTEDGNTYTDQITSKDLQLISWNIEEFPKSIIDANQQPRVFFSVKGRVETARGIYSEFNLQSTVSQRQLKLKQ